MAGTNFASQFSADIENFIADEVLPLAKRQLCAYKFGDPYELDKGRGTTYTATRFNRLPLPFQPISEGVAPPNGQSLSIAQVSVTCQQWGDKVVITDVAEMTVKHPLVKKGNELMALQLSETLERNTFNALNALTQVNYVNARGSRAALLSTDVLDSVTVNRTTALLDLVGAPMFLGDEAVDQEKQPDVRIDASQSPASMPHYVGIIHPLVVGDFANASDVKTAWQYSDINRLYNFEAGEWRGIRFCKSNLVPSWVGVAAVTGTAGTAGNLATNTYFIQVTGSDTQNQYESRIYQASAGIAVTGPTGSISVTLPTLPGFTFNVYIGTSASPTNLALTTSGPTYGPLSGQATQLASGATVVLTGIGVAQVPPAAPAAGVTVYPTYVFGKGCYGQVKLDNVKFALLAEADKSDPFNQLRVLTWKTFYGTLITNTLFGARVESSSAISPTFG